MSIPAGETFEYRCELQVKHPGPFEGELAIHLEDNGIRTVLVSVSGTVKGEIADAPPPPK